MELDKIRREYLQGGLRRGDLPAFPLELFRRWQRDVMECGLHDPTAMVVATVDAEGRPSQRIVLLKQLDDAGFVFYTNYGSRKGRDIAGNASVSLLFPWHAMDRQVKVCGRAEKVDIESSRRYFASRPRDSQLAAHASLQSEPVASRQVLIDALAELRERYAETEIPLPDNWGGIRVIPREVEFWQGGAHRMHDRFRYRMQAGGDWEITRLAP